MLSWRRQAASSLEVVSDVRACPRSLGLSLGLLKGTAPAQQTRFVYYTTWMLSRRSSSNNELGIIPWTPMLTSTT